MQEIKETDLQISHTNGYKYYLFDNNEWYFTDDILCHINPTDRLKYINYEIDCFNKMIFKYDNKYVILMRKQSKPKSKIVQNELKQNNNHQSVLHNIKFIYQPKISFIYKDDMNKIHHYFPDFLVENQLVEIKGNQFVDEFGQYKNPYLDDIYHIYENKHQCMIKNNIKILYFADIQPYLTYITQKYGISYKKFFQQFKKTNII